MIQKCLQHIMNENLFLLKDSLEPEKIKLENKRLQFQEMYTLINLII